MTSPISLSRFMDYCKGVFHLDRRIGKLRDGRKKHRIPLAVIWRSVFVMFATRMESLNRLEIDLRKPDLLNRWVGEPKPRADAIGDAYGVLDPDSQREILWAILHKLKRNRCWATSAPQAILPTRTLWEVGHHRWDIDAGLFNDLVNNWFMDHSYKHNPTAILNFTLTLLIVYLLMQAFFYRDLKPALRKKSTLSSVARDLLKTLRESSEPGRTQQRGPRRQPRSAPHGKPPPRDPPRNRSA